MLSHQQGSSKNVLQERGGKEKFTVVGKGEAFATSRIIYSYKKIQHSKLSFQKCQFQQQKTTTLIIFSFNESALLLPHIRDSKYHLNIEVLFSSVKEHSESCFQCRKRENVPSKPIHNIFLASNHGTIRSQGFTYILYIYNSIW